MTKTKIVRKYRRHTKDGNIDPVNIYVHLHYRNRLEFFFNIGLMIKHNTTLYIHNVYSHKIYIVKFEIYTTK